MYGSSASPCDAARSRLTERRYPRASLPSCQSVPSHLAAFKDCPAETGGGAGGAEGFLTAHSLAAQEGLRLRIRAKNGPPETGGMQGDARQARVRHIPTRCLCAERGSNTTGQINSSSCLYDMLKERRKCAHVIKRHTRFAFSQ